MAIDPRGQTSFKGIFELKSVFFSFFGKGDGFRSEYLTRHWSANKQGFCQCQMCQSTQIRGDLEHLLVHYPGLAPVRERLWKTF